MLTMIMDSSSLLLYTVSETVLNIKTPTPLLTFHGMLLRFQGNQLSKPYLCWEWDRLLDLNPEDNIGITSITMVEKHFGSLIVLYILEKPTFWLILGA